MHKKAHWRWRLLHGAYCVALIAWCLLRGAYCMVLIDDGAYCMVLTGASALECMVRIGDGAYRRLCSPLFTSPWARAAH
jgi:hypothetical protein